MIHQFTALILSCLMLVVSTTSQVGLHFCKCEKTVFMGDCPCDEIAEMEEITACSCCGSCGDSMPETPIPCGDCDLTIELEFDDCIPALANDYKFVNELSQAYGIVYHADKGYILQSMVVASLEIRGGPPPNHFSACASLFLRHSVFLI